MKPSDKPLKPLPEQDWPRLARSIEIESDEIRKSAEVLGESDGKASKLMQGLLNDIVKRTKKLDDIAGKIYSYSDALIEAGQRSGSVANLSELVMECVRKAAPELEKHSTSVRVLVDPEAKVKMDPGVVRSILQELIANAVEHNPPLSWIKIEAHSVMDEIVVTVKDCGTGISKEDLEKIFEKKPAKSLKDINKVFGLPEIRNLLRSYGQKIWANSAFGKGTTIYLTLPAAFPAS